MRKVIEFGKIDWNGKGRKTHPVTVEIELKYDRKDRPVFTASGNVWNTRKTDVVCAGQCLDSIFPYLRENELFGKIYRLWKLYHLNDMNKGTAVQEAALLGFKAVMPMTIEDIERGRELPYLDYDHEVRILKALGLYEDHGYRYGSGWIYREIPDADLAEIYEILGTEKPKVKEPVLYKVKHIYDVEDEYGDPEPSEETVAIFDSEEKAKEFIKKYSKPHVYDKGYDNVDIECGSLIMEVVLGLNENSYCEEDLWWLHNEVLEPSERDVDEIE